MHSRKFRILTASIILLFLYSCIKTKLYVSPSEGDKISGAKKIIVTLNDGTEVELKNVKVENKKIIGETQNETRKEIDFSLIATVAIEKKNYTYAILYGGVAILAALLIYGMETAPEPPPPESCPFIHSFNGDKYIFDAEPYGAAICQGLKRTELCGLEHIEEVDGKYRLLITNELEETQYTDELNLLVVDHPPGVKAVPNTLGGIHTISYPFPPHIAYDNRGKGLLPYVDKKDGVFWQSRIEEKNPAKKEDLRDELIFEFPKPRKSKDAKLIVNAYTTFWGSQILKRFLDLHGNEIHEWYSEVNNFGPAYYKVTNMNIREELYYLKIKVETESGWKSKGLIFGGGPFISDDKAYPIDISDVPGDTIKIKLVPPACFWMIDYIAIDYTEDLPIQIAEIEPIEAMDHKGKDVREILAKNDNNYLIMPNTGDFAELVFKSPPRQDGLERSVILRASGYYDIHLEAKGEPRREILRRFLGEPEFAVQYAFKEYLNWKEKNMNRIKRK